MAKTTVFVYGTLKRGQRNHSLLQDQEFLGEARTLPRYRLYDCGRYPALVHDRVNGVAVFGEVWRVSDEVLRRMDAYECAPELYSRQDIILECFDRLVEAYFFKGAVAGLEDCGAEWPIWKSLPALLR
jgi:gamma-glutamylaminecyclotransferase